MKCAILPLAEMVALPGETISLHIFEPRYRQMVKDCLKNQTPIGVAMAGETLFTGKVATTLEEALNSNQDTFRPNEIFGCGEVKVKRMLKDGRVFVDINIDKKVRLTQPIKEHQNIPYQIAEVDILEIHPEGDSFEGREPLKRALLTIFNKTGLGPFLNLETDLKGLSCSQMVLETLKIFPLRGELKQDLLECPNYSERALMLADFLESKFKDMKDLRALAAGEAEIIPFA